MTDFVVSKVAMSVCALMVVSILGGVYGKGMFLDSENELDSVLDDFCSVVDMASRSGAEGSIAWRVPYLSSGEGLRIVIEHGILRAWSGDESAYSEPAAMMHTWTCDGRKINQSAVDELDERAPKITTCSGHTLEVLTRTMMCDNDQRLFVFVFADP